MGKHWLDGLWVYEGYQYVVLEITGENAVMKNKANYDYPDADIKPISTATMTFGEFDDCPQEIADLTGAKKYNVKMVCFDGKITVNCVMAEDGKNMVTTTFDGSGAEKVKWVSREELEEINAKRESALNPTTIYKIQPEVQGKLLFLSGPPGVGKSTSGLKLAKNCDYVYYEADCFLNLVNPYLPLDVKDPSLAFPKQPPLKDFPEETVKLLGGMFDDYMALAEGREFNKESIKGFYTKMAEHIKQEKQRIGGSNWAVAQAVPFQWLRQHIREIIGPDCIFVVMSMTEETQASRVEKRHADLDEGMKTFFLDMLKNMAKSYENAGENEENAVNVRIAPEDTEQDVIDKILEAVKPLQ